MDDRGLARARLALMMCAHNEQPFLRANLAYHHAVGVERAYLFLDHCTDGTAAVAREFDWVEVIDKPKPPETQFMRQHQNACAAVALEKARGEGFEWLLHLDADELAFGGEPLRATPDAKRPSLWARIMGKESKAALARADLRAMLADVKPATVQVQLATHEGFPKHIDRTEDYWQNPYFQSGAPFVQRILDPTTGQKQKFDRYLGHDQGKSIVRTSADVQAFNPHRWTTAQGVDAPEFPEDVAIPTEARGCHFHYLIVNTPQWIKKYAQFDGLAMNWPSGVPLSFPKGAWRKAATEMPEAEAAAYLDEWLFRTTEELDKLVEAGDIHKEPDVATILARLL